MYCWVGVGRTGAVIGCWLVRRGNNGDDAFTQIDVWRMSSEKPHPEWDSPETPALHLNWPFALYVGSSIGFLVQGQTEP